MTTAAQIACTVDSWIGDEELPVSASLKVLRRNDPNFGLADDEIEERNEFIHWYMLQDYTLILAVPKRAPETDFFTPDCDALSPEYSAFNTHDFQDALKPFDKYGYAMKKIMERLKDLALLHSVITCAKRRSNIQRRFESIVDVEFRERLLALVERFKKTVDEERRFELKRKVGDINRRIIDCKKIWERYAPWDT